MKIKNWQIGMFFSFILLIVSCQENNNGIYNEEGSKDEIPQRKSIKEKTIVWFGDSIIEDIQGTKYLVKEVADLTGATIYNQGYGGCRMGKQTQKGNGLMYDKMCMYKIVDYIEEGTTQKWEEFRNNAYDLVVDSGDDNRSQAAELSNIDFSTIDVIVISFGTNDYGARDGALIGKNSDMDGHTFKGAINKTILKLKAKYPKVQLIFTSAIFRSRYEKADDGFNSDDYINPQGLKMSDYNNAMKEMCKIHNVTYFDMNKLSGINKSNASFFLEDGVHPNEAGSILLSKKYAELFEQYIK